MAMEFFAGCCGGAAGIIVGHPLDTVKVRLQTQCPSTPVYRGTFHCLVSVIKQESLFGLYKGIGSPLYGVAANGAVLFGVYGNLKPIVSGPLCNDALWAHFVAGSTAGAVRTLIAAPVELVKTRMQIDRSARSAAKSRPSALTVLRNVYRSEGFRGGVYRGWCVTVVRDIPGLGAFFGTHEALTRAIGPNPSIIAELGAGGCAGLASWIACFPIDVIKSRVQSDVARQYQGALDCFRKTVTCEGYRALFYGLNSTLLRAFPVNAAVLVVVRWIQGFGSHGQEKKQGVTDRTNKLEGVSL